jgi:hypothetical protein
VKSVRKPLQEAVRKAALALAYTQALSELRGKPPGLAPGAPARGSVDPAADFPFGFFDRASFDQFSQKLKAVLPAEDKGAALVMEGSGVSGRHFDRLVDMRPTGAPFDLGRISDYDIAIVSDLLLAKARERGITVSGNPLRTGPLTRTQLENLGLGALDKVAQAATREATGIPHAVHFVVVGSGQASTLRLPLP